MATRIRQLQENKMKLTGMKWIANVLIWNVGGWNKRNDSASSSIREKSLLSLDLDIIGIAETHLQDSDILKPVGYVWLGHKVNTHIKAKKGCFYKANFTSNIRCDCNKQ